MESLLNLARGCMRVEITGARPENFLNLLAAGGVEFWDTDPADDYTVRLSLHSRDAGALEGLAQRALCRVRVQKFRGAPVYLRRIRKRYTLLLGLAACLLALLYSSFFIWDIEVLGNETVSADTILNALEESGVGIGSYWPAFVSDSIRSRVLVKVPELAWLTVNVYGSRAQVIVRERIPKPELVREDVPAQVVAEKAGIISDIRVYRGVAEVSVGQTVLEGERLVSGEVISPFAGARRLHAMADVTARTWYEITGAGPLTELRKSYKGGEKTRLALIIGSSRINFYSNSGISDSSCDKIIEERQLALGGVFTLPITLVTEKRREYELLSREIDAGSEKMRMRENLESILRERVGNNGSIVSVQFSETVRDGLLIVTLRAECLEQIGAVRELGESYVNQTGE